MSGRCRRGCSLRRKTHHSIFERPVNTGNLEPRTQDGMSGPPLKHYPMICFFQRLAGARLCARRVTFPLQWIRPGSLLVALEVQEKLMAVIAAMNDPTPPIYPRSEVQDIYISGEPRYPVRMVALWPPRASVAGLMDLLNWFVKGLFLLHNHETRKSCSLMGVVNMAIGRRSAEAPDELDPTLLRHKGYPRDYIREAQVSRGLFVRYTAKKNSRTDLLYTARGDV
jgi:hypothetical protein